MGSTAYHVIYSIFIYAITKRMLLLVIDFFFLISSVKKQERSLCLKVKKYLKSFKQHFQPIHLIHNMLLKGSNLNIAFKSAIQIAMVQGSRLTPQTPSTKFEVYGFYNTYFELNNRWVQLKLHKSTKLFEENVEIWLNTFWNTNH